MKKIVAGLAATAALALGTTGVAQAYSSDPAAASHLKHKVNKIVQKKGHISKHRAHKLIKLVRAEYRAGVISKTKETILIAKIRADEK